MVIRQETASRIVIFSSLAHSGLLPKLYPSPDYVRYGFKVCKNAGSALKSALLLKICRSLASQRFGICVGTRFLFRYRPSHRLENVSRSLVRQPPLVSEQSANFTRDAQPLVEHACLISASSFAAYAPPRRVAIYVAQVAG
jgi:hypothetical protein